MEELEQLIEALRQRTFHMSNEEAKIVINDYLNIYPQLLTLHDEDWYYKNC